MMETQNNNLTPELSELREQLATFKQRLDEQQIINDRLLRQSMRSRISPFLQTSIGVDVLGLILTPIVFVVFRNTGVHWGFGVFALLMCLVELFLNVYYYQRINKLFTQPADVVTLRRGLLKYRRDERLWMIIAIPSIILWGLLVFWQMGAFSSHHVSLGRGIIGLVLGLLAAYGLYSWQSRRLSEVERELDDLSE